MARRIPAGTLRWIGGKPATSGFVLLRAKAVTLFRARPTRLEPADPEAC